MFCVSTLVRTFPPEIHIFRNYNYPMDTVVQSRYQGTCKKPIHEAVRASTAGKTNIKKQSFL